MTDVFENLESSRRFHLATLFLSKPRRLELHVQQARRFFWGGYAEILNGLNIREIPGKVVKVMYGFVGCFLFQGLYYILHLSYVILCFLRGSQL